MIGPTPLVDADALLCADGGIEGHGTPWLHNIRVVE
jgi:hypothetical protein